MKEINNLISIIIPCFNVEKYIEQCISSVVEQTYPNIEIIAVNDGSTDNTLSILERYAKTDKRISIIYTPNRGDAAARNIGLSLAKGEYIMFVDSDDFIDIKTCEYALKNILDTDADVVFWSYIRHFPSKQLKKILFDTNKLFEGEDCVNLYRKLFGPYKEELNRPDFLDAFVTVWGKLYKKDIVSDIHFEDGTTKDAWFNIRACIRVKKFAYINEYFYYYRKSNLTSITGSYREKLHERWISLYKQINNFIEENKLGNDFTSALNNRIALNIIGLGLNECASDKSSKEIIAKLNEILHSKVYNQAYDQLTLKYFPLHWKVFFYCAKKRYTQILYLLLLCIKRIINA